MKQTASASDYKSHSEANFQNSRRKKRLGFSANLPSVSAEQFVQPSKAYSAVKHPGTPPSLAAGVELHRQKQYQPQPSKSDFIKPNSRRDNKPKPYILEPPPQAQLFPDSRCSDFYPWKGVHPEDTVTDSQAKNGLYDRLFVGKGNNEQASARGSLGPLFRQRTGLGTLSSLYLTIVEKRQQYSTVSSPSTFKPPPRVTLPDQRREAWLRDLANPLVPLRRLSRTIPHGLKGPILLDQCVGKNIPTARAVWFARCVGANELRGLKRKGVGSFGVGGEAKWIKEWTGHVIQFVDKAMGGCNAHSDASWRDKLLYTIRLSAHLYAELLLDRSAFLEWIIALLEKGSHEMLPLQTILISPFWDDLLRGRRFSRRLTEALLHIAESVRLSKIVVSNYAKASLKLAVAGSQVQLPAVRRLSHLLTDILLHHQNALVLPNSWERLRNVLVRIVDDRNPHIQECIQSVNARNSALNAGTEITPQSASDRRQVIDLLDATAVPFDPGELYQQCSYMLSSTDLILCVCEWAVTLLRAGTHRVFLAVSLLKIAHEDGVNVQEPILSFLGRFEACITGSKHDVYLLISELVRWRIFSVAAYMKWLIARGSLAKVLALDQDAPCYIRLLAEIPIASSPPHVRNLRRNLLAGCGFDVDLEEQTLLEAREFLLSCGIFSKPGPENGRFMGYDPRLSERLQRMSRTVKFELALWIKSCVADLAAKCQQIGRDNWRVADSGLAGIKPAQFSLIRQMLEECCDFSVLADVIKTFVGAENSETLASVADTINFNIEVFSVLSMVNYPLQLLFEKYKKLHSRRSLEKCFLTSLVELSSCSTTNEKMKQELEFDLALYNQRYPRSAIDHSPISDAMGDSFQDVEVERNEEIDRLWNTGAIVDEDTVSRLFETTVSKLEASFEDTENHRQIIASSHGLIKLQEFDSETFGKLLRNWIRRMLPSSNRISFFRTLSALIAGSCVQPETIVGVALSVMSQERDASVSANTVKLGSEVLDLIVNDNPFGALLSGQELYTLKRQRKLFIQTSPAMFLHIIRKTIECCVLVSDESLKEHICSLVASRTTLDFLRKLAATQLTTLVCELVEPLSVPRNGPQMEWLQFLMDSLLDDHDSSDIDAHVQVGRLLHLANDFSIGLCQLKMRITFNSERKAPLISGLDSHPASENCIARSFIQGIISTFNERPTTWAELVAVLDRDCAGQIRAEAEELFLDSATFMRNGPLLERLELPLVDGQETGELVARALLSLLSATAFSIPAASTPGLSAMLVDRLTRLLRSLSADDGSDKLDATSPDFSFRGSEVPQDLWFRFLLFLRIIVLHRGAFMQNKSSIADHGRMVAGLCCLLLHDFVQRDEILFEFVFDVASAYVDGLADDARLQLQRFLKGKIRPPLAAYLTGYNDGGVDWLRASQRGKLVDFPVKAWERLAEPAPNIGENDTSLSLGLFRATKARCSRLSEPQSSLGR